MSLWILIPGLLLLVLYGALRWWTRDKPLPFDVRLGEKVFRRTAKIHDFTVSYIVAGDGAPVILVHGLGASNYSYRFLIPLLAQNFKVFALDLPGFGKSEKIAEASYSMEDQCNRVTEFIEHLRLPKVGIVGSSMGGLIALTITNQRPDLVAWCVAVSPAIGVKNLVPLFLLERSHRMLQPLLTRKTMRLLLKRVVTRAELVDEEMISAYLEPYKDRQAVAIVFRALRALLKARPKDHFKKLRTPTLVVWGRRDAVLPCPSERTVLEQIPTSVYVIHPTAGHHVQEDDPVWLSEKILNHASEAVSRPPKGQV